MRCVLGPGLVPLARFACERRRDEAVLAFYEELGYARGSSVPIEKWLDPSKRGDK